MMLRAVAMLALVAGCKPSFDRRAHLGTNGTARNATPLVTRCDDEGRCEVRARGIVTARGGDSIDWYAVDVPACDAAKLEARLTWTAPRDSSRLGIAIYRNPRRYPVAKGSGARGSATATLERAVPGRYLIKILTGPDDAGAYTLRISDGATCRPSRDLYLPRPDELASPPGGIAVVEAGMSASATDWHGEPSIVLDAGDPRVRPGARGILLDVNGLPVKRGDIEVVEIFTRQDTVRLASARLVHAPRFRRQLVMGWPYWAVQLQPLAPR
jgi:hypothetical protein